MAKELPVRSVCTCGCHKNSGIQHITACCSPDNVALDQLLEEAKNKGPMSKEEKRAQAISFVYGQLALSGRSISKEEVAQVYDELHKEVSGGE